MLKCGVDIVTIIFLALSLLAVIGKKKEPDKHVSARSRVEDLFPEDIEPESVKKDSGLRCEVKSRPDESRPEVVETEEKPRRFDIDKKKLIIYSEIMKPKFDE